MLPEATARCLFNKIQVSWRELLPIEANLVLETLTWLNWALNIRASSGFSSGSQVRLEYMEVTGIEINKHFTYNNIYVIITSNEH